MNPRVHRGRVTHDRWLVSYADFITLLFAFFVVLYAFAKTDQTKQTDVSQAIDGAFRSMGIFSSEPAKRAGGFPNVVIAEDVQSPQRVRDNLEQMQRELEQKLSIAMRRDGLVISLREAGFFDSGSAVPHPGTLGILRQIADSIGTTPYDLRVEGHTDNMPIHTSEFDSNWELSSARATRIARLMLDLRAVPAEHLSAAGYAEFHPISSNHTPEGRAKNRRVDLVVVPRTRFNFAAAPSATRSGAWAKITDE
jgi:chemotaxis protein MotB